MKNMDAYIMISIVSLILVVATAFLMIAADAPIREARYVSAPDFWCHRHLGCQ